MGPKRATHGMQARSALEALIRRSEQEPRAIVARSRRDPQANTDKIRCCKSLDFSHANKLAASFTASVPVRFTNSAH